MRALLAVSVLPTASLLSACGGGGGDLAYTLGVRGNPFAHTGGDAGILTGAFFGARHEGMGGTLVREDLTVAFGGSR